MGNGLGFREWLRQPTGLPMEGSISLRLIDSAIRENFEFEDHKDWQEAMILSIAELLRRGYGQALYDRASGSWGWTDRFICPDEFGEGPEDIGAAVVQSWLAFGDSGGAEDLRFVTELPTGAPQDSESK
jgi:hypothetical protein